MASDTNGSVPQWLADLGVKPGEYFIDSKLRAKRAMRSPCFSAPARLHIALGLCTMGFQKELAVKLEAGKEVPAQPADLCAMTGIDRRNFRREMQCLEKYGLAKCEGWTKGRFKLYAYAVPRPVDVPKIVIKPMTIPDDFPPELATLLKRFHVRLTPEIVIRSMTIPEEVLRLAREANEAVLSLKRVLDCHQNGDLYKEERNGKKQTLIQSSSSSAVNVLSDKGTTTTKAEPEPAKPPEPTPEPAPKPPEPVRPAPKPPETPPEDVSPVVEAVSQHHSVRITPAEAREIVGACREKLGDPSVSPAETARFVWMVSPIRKDGTIKSPPRFLKTAVSRAMTAEELEVLRQSRTGPLPPAGRWVDPEDDDPEISSERCPKCGGLSVKYKSGKVAACRCQAMRKLSGVPA